MRNPAILSCTGINIKKKQAVLFQAPLKLETALFLYLRSVFLVLLEHLKGHPNRQQQAHQQ